MPKTEVMDELLERMRANAEHLSYSYPTANHLLNAAVGEAFPWVLGLPVVQNKIPPMFRNALPQGAPVTLDRVERLATQLVAILAASYGMDDREPHNPENSSAGRESRAVRGGTRTITCLQQSSGP